MKNIGGLVVITKRQATALEAAKLLPAFIIVDTMLAAQTANINGWANEYTALNGLECDTMRRALTEGYTTDVRIKKITITRGEGPSKLCGIPYFADTWEGANEILAKMAIHAPDSGGYDKTDFDIEFNNGETYRGTYDLKYQDRIYGDLYRHVKDNCEFYAGKCNPLPSHIKSEAVYLQIIGDPKQQQPYRDFLEDVLYPSTKLALGEV
ncbi:hypothetical protein [Bacillus sp. FJAT-28004]|uniref:hypothetical protein n=1 Tax=Bacillus sp. FJAT-28004 TaxID=1679165 RepID=UPI0006B65BDD|nr:hypothetical protein [Bacillus sp. FJAT-28004]